MKPEAIQNERDRIGSTKRSLRKRSLNSPFDINNQRNNQLNQQTDAQSPLSPADNSETDESSGSSLSTNFIEQNVFLINNNGLCNTNITNEELNSAQNLNQNLMEIDEHVRIIWDRETKETTQRQRIVKNLLEWSSMLYPLPTLPFQEKVNFNNL